MSRGWAGDPARESGDPARESGDPALPPKGPDGGHHGLAARQAELVAALVAGGPPPPGFDGSRLDATRRALLRKRAGEAATQWPLLAASLGPDWPRDFAARVDGHPPVGALRDGWDLARALHARGDLGPAASAELAEREATLRYDGRRDPRPRGRAGAPRARSAALRAARSLLGNGPTG